MDGANGHTNSHQRSFRTHTKDHSPCRFVMRFSLRMYTKNNKKTVELSFQNHGSRPADISAKTHNSPLEVKL